MNKKILVGIVSASIFGLLIFLGPSQVFVDAVRLEAVIRTTGASFKTMAIASLIIGVSLSGLCFAVGALVL